MSVEWEGRIATYTHACISSHGLFFSCCCFPYWVNPYIDRALAGNLLRTNNLFFFFPSLPASLALRFIYFRPDHVRCLRDVGSSTYAIPWFNCRLSSFDTLFFFFFPSENPICFFLFLFKPHRNKNNNTTITPLILILLLSLLFAHPLPSFIQSKYPFLIATFPSRYVRNQRSFEIFKFLNFFAYIDGS